MEGKTLFILMGTGLLGVGAFMAAMSSGQGQTCFGNQPQSPAVPQTNQNTGSPLVSNPPSNDAIILARTAWGEARGEGSTGMQAVLNVIMNRARAGNFPGGSNPAAIATARNQFSAWNFNDPNRAKMLSVTEADPQYAEAISLAEESLNGTLSDITGGAVYYHEASIPTPRSWGRVSETTQIGNHIFYVRG